MKTPKFTFGDKVNIKTEILVHGVKTQCFVEKIICAIQAFEYSISDSSPQVAIMFRYGAAQDLMFQKHFIWVSEGDIVKL